MNWKKFWRQVHYWLSIVVALQFGVVVFSGVFLLLKKEVDWIQPPSQRGAGTALAITFDAILEAARTVDEAGIRTWEDVDRLDVRPSKGMVKVRGVNRWEVQVDAATGEVLQTAYRRSDLIESIHDGSWFHDRVKLWIFLPTALLLIVLWATGLYLFILPYWSKAKKRRKQLAKESTQFAP